VSRYWYVARRVGFAILSMYLIASLAFGFIAFTADPNIAVITYSVAAGNPSASGEQIDRMIDERVSAYRESRNLDEPIHERYVNWMVSITTLDWGVSHSKGAPVVSLLGAYLPYTLAYVVPAMVIATLVGVGSGLKAAADRHTLLDRSAVLLSYLGLGLPNFWVAEGLLIAYSVHLDWMRDAVTVGDGIVRAETATVMVLPTLILAASLVAGQLQFTRSRSIEVLETDRIKLVRAKGAGFWRVSRHVLATIAAPLLSLFLTELMSVLLVTVFVVETIFGIPGFGTLTFEAIRARDMPLVLGTTMVVAFVGVGGDLVRDLVQFVLDPRVGGQG